MDYSSENVPRWTPKASPARSPVKEPVESASVGDLETQSIVSEEDLLSSSLPQKQDSMEYSGTVPRWTPKASPGRSPLKEPVANAGVGDLDSQSIASEGGYFFSNSLPREQNNVDYSSGSVPRWTPKPNPTSWSPVKEPATIAGVGDLETQIIASEEEDFSSDSLPRQQNNLDYPSRSIPRWSPKPSPTRSPVKEPVSSAIAGDLDTKSIASEEDFRTDSLPRQQNNLDYSSGSVPRWSPKPSPTRPQPPVKEPVQSATAGDLDTQSIASEEEDFSSNSFPRQQNDMDYPSENVPRWTPRPSPTRSLVKEPETIAGVGDLETQSITSEDDLMFSNSLPLQQNHVDYPSGINVPRWSPVKEPVTSVAVGDFETQSTASSAKEDYNWPSSNVDKSLPFSIGGFNHSATQLTMHKAASYLSSGSQVVSLATHPENHIAVNHVGSVSRRDGIFLTWTDLWVTVPDGKSGRRSILQGLTGYAAPGDVLAIMGPSGCGKSTLLDSLAGRLRSNTQRTGEILINGRKEALAFGTSAYVTQDDTLMTTLTVREAVYYSAQLQLPDSMSRSEKKQRAEMTIREMGLQDSMNTRIGGWNVKGLSGGQKRRVSICIEILTRPKLLFLDEPTSGLDSAASFHVMSRIVKIAHQDGMTVIASIHQPSTEVFELFNNLCLLSTGKTVYFGPVSMAEKFFASHGFPCPTLRNPSDHYLRTINRDFDADIEQGSVGTTTTEEVIDILVKSYKSSGTFQDVKQLVSKICHQKGGSSVEKGRHASFITQCSVLTRRSFVNMYRDLGYYWLRLAIYIALCLCVGTIYYNIGMSYGSIQARGSMLMFVAAFLTFMAIGGFPSFVEDMKIFGRERLNGHYGVGAYVIGNTFSSIPYLLLISILPGAIAYYLVGLQRGVEHFAYFALVLFVCMILVESLMMIVASIVPDYLMGIITGAGIQGVMMLTGGFFRLPNDLPKPFWRYPMYYIAFHKYANQGFYKNEFEGLTFPNNRVGGPPTLTGEEILRNNWQVEMGYSKWIDLAILLGMVVLYRLMFLVIIKSAEKVKPIMKALLARPPKQSERIVDDPTSTA